MRFASLILVFLESLGHRSRVGKVRVVLEAGRIVQDLPLRIGHAMPDVRRGHRLCEGVLVEHRDVEVQRVIRDLLHRPQDAQLVAVGIAHVLERRIAADADRIDE